MTDEEKQIFEEELRAKIADEQRAKQRAYKAEWRKKNREHINSYNREYRKTHYDTKRPYERRVAIVDVTGTSLREFSSIKEASQLTGIDASAITKCCKGKLKTSGDFIWRYIDG